MELVHLLRNEVQTIHCGTCQAHMDLSFVDFDEEVSGIRLIVRQLPTLVCPACGSQFLPDRARLALIRLHEEAAQNQEIIVEVSRRKSDKTFKYGKVGFLYDPDDYDYIPGLMRPGGNGFLTPVFFEKDVLIKYDVHPSYQVRFGARTYGSIHGQEFDIDFGINRHGRVVMWLGDIDALPETEQFYLRSENVPSDHSIGSEFYDGQIDVAWPEPSPEDVLLERRSRFLEVCAKRFGQKIAHLDDEVLEVAVGLRPPLVDTPETWTKVADSFNKVFVESLDNKAMGTLLTKKGVEAEGLRSLKRLQLLLNDESLPLDVPKTMASLFALYDLRVALLHLSSKAGTASETESVLTRLNLPGDANLVSTYDGLVAALSATFGSLADALQAKDLHGG